MITAWAGFGLGTGTLVIRKRAKQYRKK